MRCQQELSRYRKINHHKIKKISNKYIVIQTKNQQKSRIVQLQVWTAKAEARERPIPAEYSPSLTQFPAKRCFAEKHPRKPGTVVISCSPQRNEPSRAAILSLWRMLCSTSPMIISPAEAGKWRVSFQRHDIPLAINDLPITGSRIMPTATEWTLSGV